MDIDASGQVHVRGFGTGIHTLPDELLRMVFETHGYSKPSDIRIGHVCKRWRGVLLEMSQFWADAVKVVRTCGKEPPTVDTILNRLEAFLPRTGSRPLAFVLDDFNEEIWLTLSPYANRVSALTLAMPRTQVDGAGLARLHEVMTQFSLPNLQHFGLSWAGLKRSPHITATPWDVTTTHLPQLRTLSVPLAHFSNTIALRLTTIELEGLMRCSQQTVFLNTLSNCPALVKLTLDIRMKDSRAPRVAPPQVVLPCLRWFTITARTVPPVVMILRHVIAPNCANFRLRFAVGNQGMLQDVLERMPPGFQLPGCEAAAACGGLVITLSPSPSSPRDTDSILSIFGITRGATVASRTRHLDVELRFKAADTDAFERFLCSLRSVLANKRARLLIVNVPGLNRTVTAKWGPPWERIVDCFPPSLRTLGTFSATGSGVKRRVATRCLQHAARAASAPSGAACSQGDKPSEKRRTFTLEWMLDGRGSKPRCPSAVKSDLEALVHILSPSSVRDREGWSLRVHLAVTRETKHLSKGLRMYLADPLADGWKPAILGAPYVRKLVERADEVTVHIFAGPGQGVVIPLLTLKTYLSRYTTLSLHDVSFN